MEYTYQVDLCERDEFYAHVEDEGGNLVYAIDSLQHLEEMIIDGYMAHYADVQGLSEYLQSMVIMLPGSQLHHIGD